MLYQVPKSYHSKGKTVKRTAPNFRAEIRVKPKADNIIDFIGREKIMDAGLCVTYTGATFDDSVWVEAKEAHLKRVIGQLNLEVVTPMQEIPRAKPPVGATFA